MNRKVIRILFRPLKKVSVTLINIIAFDIAMAVYNKARTRLTKPKPEKGAPEVIFTRPKLKRRW